MTTNEPVVPENSRKPATEVPQAPARPSLPPDGPPARPAGYVPAVATADGNEDPALPEK